MFLDRFRDLGYVQCNICLKPFKNNERVKRFPRECDHLFHIKCLEVWLKIEANCPNCFRAYLGPKYVNPSLNPDEDPEQFSALTSWQFLDSRCDDGSVKNLITECVANPCTHNIDNQISALDLNKTRFKLNQYSANPFKRQAFIRHQEYMEEVKKKGIMQKLLEKDPGNGQAANAKD